MRFLEELRRLRRRLGEGVGDPAEKPVHRALALVLRPDSNCVDVGAHVGATLQPILRFAPLGAHIAIEPLPQLAARLRQAFPGVVVHEVALSDQDGRAEFQHVVRAPAYSGLRRRRYEREDEAVVAIEVMTRRLDDLVASSHRVDLIKIDVEGGELGVLRGAKRIMREHRPFLIFEHGLGSADFYGTRPSDVYALLADDLGYRIFTLEGWLAARQSLDLVAMEREFEECRSYMFVASAAATP